MNAEYRIARIHAAFELTRANTGRTLQQQQKCYSLRRRAWASLKGDKVLVQ